MKELIKLNNIELRYGVENFIDYIDVSDKTLKNYCLGIDTFMKYLNDKNINRPTRNDLRAFRDVLKLTHSANTVNSYMTGIRELFKYLALNNLYEDISVDIKGCKVSNTIKTQSLNIEKVREIYKSLTNKREKAIFSLAITTGMRANEICNSKIENIKEFNDEMVLFHSCKKRDDESEYNKLSEQTLKDIQDYINGRTNGYIFIGEGNKNRGEKVTTKTIRTIIKNIFKRFGIDEDYISCHTLRRTTATIAYENGKSIYDIQQVLHQKSIATTSRYIQQITRNKNNSENMLGSLLLGGE